MAITDFVGFLLIEAFSVIFAATIIGLLKESPIDFGAEMPPVILVLSIAVPWYTYFCSSLRKRGQTFGMRVHKYKLVPIKGLRLSFGQVLLGGFILLNPVTFFLDVLHARVPPYITLVESQTDTRIVDV